MTFKSSLIAAALVACTGAAQASTPVGSAAVYSPFETVLQGASFDFGANAVETFVTASAEPDSTASTVFAPAVVPEVPEPSSYVLMLLGVLAIAGISRRRPASVRRVDITAR